MIAFLRKVRRKLLSQNRITRYLAYAFGEIILVVIGILIALQINNWNEENKVDDSIRRHLSILRSNLSEDQIRLRELEQAMTDNFNYSDSLLGQFKTLIPVSGSAMKYLGYLILEYQFSPNTNAIETIKQSNEIPFMETELRTAILDYYSLIARMKERETVANTQIQTKYEPYINNNYPEIFQRNNQMRIIRDYYKDDPRPLIPFDEDKFLNDKVLEGLVTSRYYQCERLKEFYSELLASSDRVLHLLPEDK